MRRKILFVLSGMLLFGAGRAAAQAWDAPYYVPPAVTPGLGIYLMDVAGGDLGVGLTWRPRAGSFGLRAGIAETPVNDIGVFGGIDFSGPITRSNYNFPLDVDWVFGAGLGVSDYVLVTVPLGVTLGHTFHGQGASFTPYLTPRVSLDAAFNNGNSDADLALTVDFGLDLRFSQRFLVRFGAAMGDHEALGIGLVF
ncbi:MAG TPA: hypothetical protein VF021_07760 [Longimicrobiales bacterium]